MVQIKTIFLRKTQILIAKTPKFASARVAQIMTNFCRKTLILTAKTAKFPPARMAQNNDEFLTLKADFNF